MADLSKTYKIAVIGSRLLATGMGLSGVKHIYTATNQEETENAIREISSAGDIGIVIINENLAGMVRDRRLLKLMDNSLSPIFVSIPSFNQAEFYQDTLRKLIIRAIGIDISETHGKNK